MNNLIKSEVLKIRSTQVWFWMLVLSVGFTALLTIASVATIVENEPVAYYDIFTRSGSAGVALLVLGLLGLTTEFRHKTITPTLLATPNRWKLLAGKAASYGLFSVFYALVCVIVNFAIAIPWLAAKNIPVELGHGIDGGVAKAFVSLVLYGLFGLGIGAVIRNQAAAMVFGIVYLFIINGLLSVIAWVRLVYPFTPGGALQAFASNGHIDGLPGDVHMLQPLVGGLVMLIWVAALILVGGRLALQRDIS
jgi:ABC-2 type transport system permease protein